MLQPSSSNANNTTDQLLIYRLESFPDYVTDPLYCNYNSLLSSNLCSSSFNYSYFINDVRKHVKEEEDKTIDITHILANNDDNITIDSCANLPLFFINKNLIKIPSKIERTLRRYTPKHLLYAIHSDLNVAVELCLLFSTRLTGTYFEIKDGSNPQGWKPLMAKYLREFLYVESSTYKKVITALEYPLLKGQILECDHMYTPGAKTYFYRLEANYIGKGIVEYELKTKEAQTLLNKHYFRMLSESNKNPICKNLIKLYQNIQLPSIEQIKKEAKRLIKLEDGLTKKGKKLTFLNKHSRDYFKNQENLSFVEDAIEIYKYLTSNGVMIPCVGGDNNGGRVVDSFTLMPSWIRKMVKLGGKKLIECDYATLHPNIAIHLYNGNTGYVSHGDIENELKLDINTVKTEHLSFFNKEVWAMKKSSLYAYYLKHEPGMLKRIIDEKYSSEYKHKITSRKMFKKEVEIMTDVIQQLNEEGIYVLYVYDALLCLKKDVERVAILMDEIILKHGVKTVAKIGAYNKYNPIVANLKETKLTPEELLNITQPCPVPKVKNLDKSICIDGSEINFSIRIKDTILKKMEAGESFNFMDVHIKFSDGDVIKEKVLRINDEVNTQLKYVTYDHIYGTGFQLSGGNGGSGS